MEKVQTFKSTLVVMDWLVVILLLAVAIGGVWFGAQGGSSNFLIMVLTVFGAAIAWVIKVLFFGIAYCAIATAENTMNIKNRDEA